MAAPDTPPSVVPNSPREALARISAKLKKHPTDGRLLDEAAVLLYQLGELAAAAQTAEAAAAASPKDALIHDHLGLILVAAGRPAEAAAAARRAVALAPREGAFALNCGNALLAAGDHPAAAAALERATDLLPRQPLAWFNRGNALALSGARTDALRCLRKAITLAPHLEPARRNLALLLREAGQPAEAAAVLAPLAGAGDPAVLHLLGVALIEAGDAAAAVAPLQRLTALQPENADAHLDLARAFARLSRSAEAAAACAAVLRLRPDEPVAWSILGSATADPAAAEAHFRRALVLRPRFPDATVNLSRLLVDSGRAVEGLALLDDSLLATPDHAELHYARAVALVAVDQVEAALEANRRAFSIAPGHHGARLNHALCELRLADHRHGWPDYEARWLGPTAEPRRFTTLPEWPADCPRHGHLLVWSEQGIGDEVMFATLLPALLPRVDRITVACAPRLQPLFARSFPEVTVIAQDPDPARTAAPVGIDWQLPAGSLPARLWTGADHPAGGRTCLVPAPGLVTDLRSRYTADGRPAVGLAWRTTNPKNGKARTIEPRDWAPALRYLPCRFVSLQYGDCTADLAAASAAGLEVLADPTVDALRNLDAFAAQVAALDAIVTIDNSTIHFAGALGRPAWLLTPTPADWRWRSTGSTSVWYPNVHIHRRAISESWPPVLARAAAELAAALASQKP